MKLSEIFEGWRNHLIPPEELKSQIEEISNKRLSICRECPRNSINYYKTSSKVNLRPDEHCVECGCTLAAKTKSLKSQCPLGKWLSELTEEQQSEIEKSLK